MFGYRILRAVNPRIVNALRGGAGDSSAKYTACGPPGVDCVRSPLNAPIIAGLPDQAGASN